jgi:hypothetical protein
VNKALWELNRARKKVGKRCNQRAAKAKEWAKETEKQAHTADWSKSPNALFQEVENDTSYFDSIEHDPLRAVATPHELWIQLLPGNSKSGWLWGFWQAYWRDL